MGNISIISRRLADGHIQYGWSGNGGYFNNLGNKLLTWYNEQDEDMIEYLFSLGQFAHLGEPHSEEKVYRSFWATKLTDDPHYLGTTEREIFSKIAFIDYGYFYDIDQQWYYIIPGPFRIKMPLRLISNNLDDSNYEFEYLVKIRELILTHIFFTYPEADPEFKALLSEINIEHVFEEISSDNYPLNYFFKKHKNLFNYFDDWVVVKADDNCKVVESIIMKKKSDTHVETIYWD